MAKKQIPNVAEQLKKFNNNIGDEEIVDKHDIKDYGFKKKEDFRLDITSSASTGIGVSSPTQKLYVSYPTKLSKDELIEKVLQISSIQIGLINEIIEAITDDGDTESIRDKILQIHTFDVRLVDEVLMNL